MDPALKDIYVQYPQNRKIVFHGLTQGPIFFFCAAAFGMFDYVLIRTIMPLYLKKILHFTELESKEIFHLAVAFEYILTILVAIVADNWIGYYYPVLVGILITMLSKFILAASAIPTLNLPRRSLIFVYYPLYNLGRAMKGACLYSLEGDQFVLPDQSETITFYYYLVYYLINIIATIATIITPILREDVHCFGDQSCYSLPIILSIFFLAVFLIIYMSGKRFYIIKKTKHNILGKVLRCIIHACNQRRKRHAIEKRDYWLDYSVDEYGEKFVEKIRILIRIFIVFLPITFYDALYSQQYTSWVYTASKMDGDMIFLKLLPDQLHFFNPLIVLMFVPVVKTYVLPYFRRKNFCKKLLEQFALGIFLTALSFIVVTILQFRVETEEPVLPQTGEAQLRIYNSIPCAVAVTSDEFSTLIPGLDVYENKNIKIDGNRSISYKATIDESCTEASGSIDYQFVLKEKEMAGHHLTTASKAPVINPFEDSVKKDGDALPKIRHLVSTDDAEKLNVIYYGSNDKKMGEGLASSKKTIKGLKPGVYTLKINEDVVGEVDIRYGGVYVALISYTNPKSPQLKLVTITPPNTLHMLWMVIPYFLMTIGEIFTAVPLTEFSYTQAPRGMKACVQAIVYSLKHVLGNALVVIIEQFGRLSSRAVMYSIWTGSIFVALGVFIILARNYKYVVIIPEGEEEKED